MTWVASGDSSTREQLNDQHDKSNDQKQMDETPKVEHEAAQQPQDQNHRQECPEHLLTASLRPLAASPYSSLLALLRARSRGCLRAARRGLRSSRRLLRGLVHVNVDLTRNLNVRPALPLRRHVHVRLTLRRGR